MIRSLFIALLIFCTISLKAQQPKSEKGDLYYQEAKDWQAEAFQEDGQQEEKPEAHEAPQQALPEVFLSRGR